MPPKCKVCDKHYWSGHPCDCGKTPENQQPDDCREAFNAWRKTVDESDLYWADGTPDFLTAFCAGRHSKREFIKDSAVYKALWSLRHAMQVNLHTTQGEAMLLFGDDDYFVFDRAKANWERQSLRFLKECLDQADRALSQIEVGKS